MIWFLSVPNAAAASLLAYADVVLRVEAAGGEALCLADQQQMRLVL